MREDIEKLLMDAGITPNLMGFDYLIDAIEMINESSIKPQMSEIYMGIGEKCQIEWRCVERCIRTAIQKMDMEFWEKIGGKSNKLRNEEVIFTLALFVKRGNR